TTSLDPLARDLGERWEILDTGITVKLYPSCAGTHPALDAVLDLRRAHGFDAGAVDWIRVGVDDVTPTILIYPAPNTPLEGKFSMPFCIAAAVACGTVGLDTFDDRGLHDREGVGLQSRVRMDVDRSLDAGKPKLTQARVTIRLTDGRELTAYADGARGYPERPARDDELDAKFRSCAARALGE